MRQLFLMLNLICLSCYVNAEPLQDGFRYGTYGMVAGALAGGTSIALSEDPGSTLAPVAKGASLGLYAGLIVAVVKNMDGWNKHQFDVHPIGWSVGKEQGMGLALTKTF